MKPLLSLARLAEFLGFSVSHTRQRVVCLPDFPKPIRLCKNGDPRWFHEDVERWLLELRVSEGLPVDYPSEPQVIDSSKVYGAQEKHIVEIPYVSKTRPFATFSTYSMACQ